MRARTGCRAVAAVDSLLFQEGVEASFLAAVLCFEVSLLRLFYCFRSIGTLLGVDISIDELAVAIGLRDPARAFSATVWIAGC